MAAVSSVADLVSQMQQNLDAIHHHLARISDTKSHDDEIQRLENEREKRIEELRAQREQHQHELEEKRKMAAEAAAEKRRAEREKIAARRKQEEDDLAAARKREEEEIAARRKREDEERQARLQQEEEELKAIARKEEEEREAIHAAEIEKKRLEAEEKENAAQDEVDNQMVILEDEMERKMAEGQKVLKELDEKRKAINAMIDAQMKPSAVTPTFRRGSKRYSGSPLAADVAAMLARKASPPPPRPSGLRNEEHASAPMNNEEQKPREIINGNATSGEKIPDLEEAHHEEAPAGEVTSTTHERDSAANNNSDVTPAVAQHASEAERERTEATRDAPVPPPVDSIPTPRNISPVEIKPAHNEPEIPKDLPTPAPSFSELEPKPLERVMSSNANIRSNTTEHEDAEDIRAREEMARMNAEIMAEMEAAEREAAAAAEQSAQHEPMQQPEVEQIVADTMQTASLEPQEVPAEPPVVSSPVERKRASFEVHEDPEDVRAREEMARINAEIMAARRLSEEKAYESVSQLVRRQSMRFSSSQSSPLDLEDVKAREEMERLNAEILAEARAAEAAELARQQLCTPQTQDVNVTPHQIFPTWQDTAELPVVHGSHGVLAFRDGGADMNIVDAPIVEDIPEAPPVEEKLAPFVYDGPVHQLLPTWADTANLPIVSGSHGLLNFRDDGADMVVVAAPQREEPVNQPSPKQLQEITPFVYEGPRHELLPTWANTADLPIVSGSHGVLSFRDGGADMEVVQAPQESHIPEPVSQPQKEIITPFVYDGPRHQLIPTWQDQSTLPEVLGAHGMLVFREGGADMSVVEYLSQDDLPSKFSEPTKLDPFLYGVPQHQLFPTWQDQSTLPEVRAAHGMLVFREGGADMEPVHPPAVDERVQASRPRALSSAVPEATWFGQAKSVAPRGHPHNLTRLDSAEQFTTHMPGAFQTSMPVTPESGSDDAQPAQEVSTREVEEPLPVVVEAAEPEPEPVPENLEPIQNHTKHRSISERFPFLAARMAAKEEANQKESPKLPLRPEEESLVVEQQARGRSRSNSRNIPNGLGSATMNHGTEKKTPVPKLAPENMPEDVVVVKGVTYDLEHPALEELVQNNRVDPYWLENQATLPTLKGANGLLVFNDGLVSMEAVKALPVETPKTTQAHPYWSANQASLEQITGRHSTLVFHSAGADMTVFQDPVVEDLAIARGPVVEKMMADMDMPLESQASIEKKSHPYWSADQASLESISGSHLVLVFHDKGADMKAVQAPVVKDVSADKPIENSAEKSLVRNNPHPYWVLDQGTLSLVQGTHGMLSFRTGGADLEVVNPPVVDAEVKSEKKTPAPTQARDSISPYFAVNQAELEVLRGDHAVLVFGEHGVDMIAAFAPTLQENPTSKPNEQSPKEAVSARAPHPYWSVDQGKLEVLNASHGKLVFGDEGATMVAHHMPVHEEPTVVLPQPAESAPALVSTASNPAAYWSPDQGSLEVLRGAHATLHFTDGGASMQVTEVRQEPEAAMSKAPESELAPPPAQSPQSLPQNPAAYWGPDQGSLQLLNASHGRLVFSDEGASMVAHQIPIAIEPAQVEKPRSVPDEAAKAIPPVSLAPNPPAYWGPNQADLETFISSHAMLVFNSDGAAMIPREKRQNHIASRLNNFDHFTDESIPHAKPADDRFPIDDDSDASSVSSFNSNPVEEGHEIAHLVARDAHSASHERDRAQSQSLEAVPELESESTLNPTGDHIDEPEEYPVDENFHHDAKRNSEHMLFEDSDDDDEDEGNEFSDQYQDAEDYPEPAPAAHRSSMGPGAFASLVNIVKDNVPLVGQLVDPANGTYSPIHEPQQSLRREPSLHIRTDTADTFPSSEVYTRSHEAGSSPITPSDSTASPIQPSQHAAEPVTRLRSDSAWPQRANHEAEFDAYDAHQDIQPKVSTHPTQAEFDPYNPQSYAPALKSPSSIRSFQSNRVDLGEQTQPSPVNSEFHLDPRSQYKHPAEIDTAAQANNGSSSSLPLRSNSGSRPQSGVFNASQSPLPSPSARPTARRGTVPDRIGSISNSRSPSSIPGPTFNIFAKTRALFENASNGPPSPEPPRTRPLSGVFHVTPMKSKRSSLIQSEQAMPSSPSDSGLAYGDTDDEMIRRSLDGNGRPPSPVFRHSNGSKSGDDGDEDFYTPAERHTNPFLGALGSLTNGLSSSIHNPANKRSRETERLLHGSGGR